jgi:hypothetical protein
MRINTGIRRLAFVIVTAGLAVYAADSRSELQQRRATSWSGFGVSVAAASGFLFVAANAEQGGKRGPGTVHIFQRRGSAWVHVGVLLTPEATVEDDFGVSMAAHGNILVVGAQFADLHGDDSGVAYVFELRHQKWQQAAVLSAEDAAPGDQFGLTVSVSNETIAVGARLEDSREKDGGATYLFQRRSGIWQQVAKLTASDARRGDLFGRVSIDDDMMVVSADLNDDRGNAAGKAYAFEKRGGKWTEVATITASNAAAGDEFGFALALRSGTAVLGAVGADGHAPKSGAAYVFERRRRQWVETARLTASEEATSQLFGFSVSALVDLVVVGAPGDRKATGAAYVFERRNGAWTQTAKLGASDARPQRRFGNSVAATHNSIVVGALTNGDGTHPGAAYVFERRGGSWSEVTRLVRP